ncbi:MAG TPA: aldo/keto reductase [Candidatus Hydrogenedentes bacterium]|nr:aldo/keto reductase [Candidatus Hydrogenedentota bacterium]
MTPISRRNFLGCAAGAVAATAFAPGSVAAVSALPRATDTRALGRTGIQCSWLGMGTGIRGSGPGITDLTLNLSGNQIVDLLEYAYAQGISYFDLADRYGSHNHMRLALRRSIPRDKVMILSKVWSRKAERVKKDLERFKEELQTDYIDVALMHCVRQGEEDWPETLRPAMDVLEDAKAKGFIRAHGVSCHVLPALERVPDEPWCDVALVRINPFNSHMDGPVEKVVPVIRKIHDAGKGVLGMKILGEGAPEVVANMDESLTFAGSLGTLDAMTIGFMSGRQIDEVMARINAAAEV